MSEIIDICNQVASGAIIFYALVNVLTGNDNTGQVGRGYFGLQPYRTLQAAVNALSRQLQGESSIARGQAIIINSPTSSVERINGNLTIPRGIFVRPGDAQGTYNIFDPFGVPLIAINGTLNVGPDTRFESLVFQANNIISNGTHCAGRVVFRRNNVIPFNAEVQPINNNQFFNITDGRFALRDGEIEASVDTLFNMKNSTLALQGCKVVERDGEVGFDLHNSKVFIDNCNLDFEVDTFLHANNESSLQINNSDMIIKGGNVILNDINSSNAKYDRTFINLQVDRVKDVTNGNKVIYNFDTFLGNFEGLLDEDTAEYNVITKNGIISSQSAKVLRCLTEYSVQCSDQYLVFKHSKELQVVLPNNTYNGRTLSIKFIDVRKRAIRGRFNDDDIEKMKKLNILNLVYINKVWYLI
ncbi:Hypothetical protein ORPV_232 [Orpheovirus IHUMI-LCC2]|uniref:Uncharacterized protein n=1 Tax=Orpheovirus IHUMI-LCC2 TaxID=2023057 RepID=A0A2I2L3N0_9VIRU|nr:Hypothetical protein ORPV_232 [Orpheovirus IHUMI-LCC2]SNW62136.1 Hypothetical protein ORPV_232 [Orpheovirus IHUMI-LCC2]